MQRLFDSLDEDKKVNFIIKNILNNNFFKEFHDTFIIKYPEHIEKKYSKKIHEYFEGCCYICHQTCNENSDGSAKNAIIVIVMNIIAKNILVNVKTTYEQNMFNDILLEHIMSDRNGEIPSWKNLSLIE